MQATNWFKACAAIWSISLRLRRRYRPVRVSSGSQKAKATGLYVEALPSSDTDMSKLLRLPFNIEITIEAGGVAHLTSQLRQDLVDEQDGDLDVAGNAATDAIECLLLALVAAGVDLDTAAARGAIETAVESVTNLIL